MSTLRRGRADGRPTFDAAKTREEVFLLGSAEGEGTRNPFYSMSGKWVPSSHIGCDGEGGECAEQYVQACIWPVWTLLTADNTPPQPLSVLNGYPSASFTAQVPDNTSFLLLNGTSQPLLVYYTVTLDPPVPGAPGSATFNALQGYCNGVAYFIAPLDPTVRYNLSLSVGGNVLTGPVGVHSMTFWSALW